MNRRSPARPSRLALAVGLLAVTLVGSTAAATSAAPVGATGASSTTAPYVPPVKHVFVINIENKGYAETWGASSPAPYLAHRLRGKGVLMNAYYGTAHNSQPNYVAQISGQAPNPQMQGDCQTYSDFVGVGSVAPGQLVGTGCVFPAGTPTLVSQLDASGRSWRGYMQGMSGTCEHPALNSVDGSQKATATHEYAARHDPFVYFHDVVDRPAYCAQHVVGLGQLRRDLRHTRTTRNLTYITPDLCSDGHDAPCADGRPGGLRSVNTFMKQVVPMILRSPAFRRNGMLVITADESDGPQSDATACCGEGAGPNTPQPGIVGPGGGLIGALVISRWTRGGTWSTTPYNHYSLLASIEDVFGLPHLGEADGSGISPFGLDVYNRRR